jgi:hypothetical protein
MISKNKTKKILFFEIINLIRIKMIHLFINDYRIAYSCSKNWSLKIYSIALKPKSFMRKKQDVFCPYRSKFGEKPISSGIIANAFIETHNIFKVVNPDLKSTWFKSHFRTENGIFAPSKIINYSEVLKMIRTQNIVEIRWPNNHIGYPLKQRYHDRV